MLKNCAQVIQEKIKYMDKDFELIQEVSRKHEMSKHHLSLLEQEVEVTLKRKSIRPAPITRSPASLNVKRQDFIGGSPKANQSANGIPKREPNVDILRADLVTHQISNGLNALGGKSPVRPPPEVN